MGLRFILGRSGIGKTTRCLKEISKYQSVNDGRNIIFIVPEQFTLQAERELLKNTKDGAMLKARVLSFKRLAYNVFSKEGNLRNIHLSNTAKIMVLRKIIAERREELNFFKSLSDKRGFMQQLSEMIRELFSYGITPEQLLNEDNPDIYLRGKIEDLSLIYKDYRDFVGKGYLTDDDTLDLLAPKLEESSLIKGAKIWIDGFYGFTPQEYGIIERLLESADMVTVTLTMDPRLYRAESVDVSSLFYETWNTANKLKDICEKNGIQYKAMASATPYRYKNDTLKDLEASFVSANMVSKRSDGIEVYSADNVYEEAEHTAQTIISLVRDKGLRFRDIAVFVSSPETYHTVIKGIFDDYGIPVFMDNKMKAAMHPLAEAVRSAVDIVAYDFCYEDVFTYLKTGFSGIAREDVDLIENYCLAYGIKGYKWRLENWSYGKNNYSDDELLCINELKNRIAMPFEEFFDVCGGGKKTTVKNICVSIMEFLKKIDVLELISKQTDEFKLSGRNDRAYENEQCWNAVCEVLKDAADIIGDYEMTAKEFSAVFEAGIMDIDVGIIPYGVDNVTIGDIKRSRLPDIKALFIMGANDSLIPSTGENVRLINDDERELLGKIGIELASWGKRKFFEEEFLIYGAMTKAEEMLFISYCKGDLESAELKPSVIITRLLRIFPECRIKNKDDYSPVYGIVNKKSAIKAAALEKGTVFGNSVFEVLEEENDEKTLKLVKKLNKSINKLPKLDKKITDRLYGNGIYTSISRLERYAACPFSYFMEYNLKAKERKLYSIDNPDMGSMLHSIIERFSNVLLDKGIDWKNITQPECEKMVEEIVDELAPTMKDEILISSSTLRYAVIRLKRIAKRAVWVLIKHIKAGHFIPAGYEVGFGAGEQMPPVIIEIEGGGKLVLNGKIDRVDYYDKDGTRYVKVIDYKSGKKAFSFKDIYYGLQLQLVLYMDSIIKSLEKDGIKAAPAGMFYYRVMDPTISAKGDISQDEIEKLLFGEFKMSGLVLKDEDIYKAIDINNYKESQIIPVKLGKGGDPDRYSSVAGEKSYKDIMKFAEKRAAQLGGSIVKGDISVSPYVDSKKSPCGYCAYKSVCLIDEGMNKGNFRKLETKKASDFWDEIDESE